MRRQHRTVLPSMLVVLIFLICISGYAYARIISFLCMNDFHAAVQPVKAVWLEGSPMTGGAACVAGYVRHFRKQVDDIIWIVPGDIFMGHYLDFLTKGEAMISFMNMIPPDCFALGNHEFDYGADLLEKRVGEAGFPVICANIESKTHEPFVPPYIIIERGQTKILFIGIICKNLPNILSKGLLGDLEVTDPVAAIMKWTEKLDKEVDLTAIVSHSGLSEDRRIAGALSPETGVDIIIGGHSHDLMKETEMINGIIICQAGSKGHYLGHLVLDLDEKEKVVRKHTWEVVPVLCNDGIKPDAEVRAWLSKRLDSLAPQMEKVIGHLDGSWDRDKDKLEWAVADFATDAFEEQMDVDIGIYNRGGIRKSLYGPLIRVKDIWEIFPFGNYMVRFRLSGRQLKTLLETHLSFKSESLFFSKNLRYTFDRELPVGKRLMDVTIRGLPVEPDRLYTVGTISFLWGHSEGDFGLSQEEIKANGEWKEICNLIDRDIIINRVKDLGHVKARLDGRVKETKKPHDGS